MPFMLITFGVLFVIAAYRNNLSTLGNTLSSDFAAVGGFFGWFVAIFIIGAFGYYPPARGVSRAFLALLILAMLVANAGVFAQFQSAFKGAGASGQGDNATGGATDKPADGTSTDDAGAGANGDGGAGNTDGGLDVTVHPSTGGITGTTLH